MDGAKAKMKEGRWMCNHGKNGTYFSEVRTALGSKNQHINIIGSEPMSTSSSGSFGRHLAMLFLG